uniref:Uncharacterized protein n=1 Tax=Arundo donax TaxID=35708 RepID=A0A0A8Y4H9_ARUDO
MSGPSMNLHIIQIFLDPQYQLSSEGKTAGEEGEAWRGVDLFVLALGDGGLDLLVVGEDDTGAEDEGDEVARWSVLATLHAPVRVQSSLSASVCSRRSTAPWRVPAKGIRQGTEKEVRNPEQEVDGAHRVERNRRRKRTDKMDLQRFPTAPDPMGRK